MSDEPEKPWWHGTEYEVLPPMVDDQDEVTLSASYLPSNGIRIRIVDDGPEQQEGCAEFDLSTEQAKALGEALLRWVARRSA